MKMILFSSHIFTFSYKTAVLFSYVSYFQLFIQETLKQKTISVFFVQCINLVIECEIKKSKKYVFLNVKQCFNYLHMIEKLV